MGEQEREKKQSTEFVRVFSNYQDLKKLTMKNASLKKYFQVVSYSQLEDNYLSDYKIIVATLCSVGRICSFAQEFTYIFIDEVAANRTRSSDWNSSRNGK